MPPSGPSVSESVLLGRTGAGRTFRFRSAAVSWRLSRGDAVRSPGDGDSAALTSVLRAMYPPEVVVVAVQHNDAPVPDAWRAFFSAALREVKGVSGATADYTCAAHVEKGGSYLAVYSLSSGSRVPDLAIQAIRVGGFTHQRRHNTAALITLTGGGVVGVANWALPRRTGRAAQRSKATFALLGLTAQALGVGGGADVACGEAKVCVEEDGEGARAGGQLEEGAALLAACDLLLLAGAFESRTVGGRDQLAHAMKLGLALPMFTDADAKGACVTSYFARGGGAASALAPRPDVPPGRTARVLHRGKNARTVSCRVVNFADVPDKPLAAIIEAELPVVRALSAGWRARLGVETRLAVARSVDPLGYYASELTAAQAAEHLGQLLPLAAASGEPGKWTEQDKQGAKRALDAVAHLDGDGTSSPVSPVRQGRLREELGRYIIRANAACGLAAGGTSVATALATLQARDEADGRAGVELMEAQAAAELLLPYHALLGSFAGLRREVRQDRARRAREAAEDAVASPTPPGGAAAPAADLSDGSDGGAGPASDVSDGEGWFVPSARPPPLPTPVPPLLASSDCVVVPRPAPRASDSPGTPPMAAPSSSALEALLSHADPAAAAPEASPFAAFPLPSPPPAYVQSERLLSEMTTADVALPDAPPAAAPSVETAAEGAFVGGGAPDEGAPSSAGGASQMFYSPAYYLPPGFTLLWSVARECIEDGRLQTSNIERIALGVLGEAEHYDMLIERGKLMQSAKESKRARELTRREQDELAELRAMPKITRWARELPSRGDFYSYSCEWHDRSRKERDAKKDMEERKELAAMREEHLTSRVTEASRQMLKSMEYKSPVTQWQHHAVEAFAKKHQQPGPGGVFEPVITDLGYKVGKRPQHILDRNNDKIKKKHKKLAEKYFIEKREYCDADGNPYPFKPEISKHAKGDGSKREWEMMYAGIFRQHAEKEKKWKNKHIEKFKEDCPFRPIEKNAMSEKILESKAKRQPLHKGRFASKSSGLLTQTPSRTPDPTPTPPKVFRKDEEILEKALAMHTATGSKKKMKHAIDKATVRRDDDFKEVLGIGDGRAGAFTPLIDKNSQRIMKRKMAAARMVAEDIEDEEDECVVTPEPPPTLHSAKSKGRTASPYHVPKRLQVVTSRGLYSRPRSEPESASRRTASSERPRSPASQYYTPMRSASAAPWLAPHQTPPPPETRYPDNASTPDPWATRGPMVASTVPSATGFSTASGQHMTCTPPPYSVHTTTPGTGTSDPYSAIEEHLNTMCGVLDDYLTLEGYASNMSVGRTSRASLP